MPANLRVRQRTQSQYCNTQFLFLPHLPSFGDQLSKLTNRMPFVWVLEIIALEYSCSLKPGRYPTLHPFLGLTRGEFLQETDVALLKIGAAELMPELYRGTGFSTQQKKSELYTYSGLLQIERMTEESLILHGFSVQHNSSSQTLDWFSALGLKDASFCLPIWRKHVRFLVDKK